VFMRFESDFLRKRRFLANLPTDPQPVTGDLEQRERFDRTERGGAVSLGASPSAPRP
jgi:hypothetical protein